MSIGKESQVTDQELLVAQQFERYFSQQLFLAKKQQKMLFPRDDDFEYVLRVSWLMRSSRLAAEIFSCRERGFSWFLRENTHPMFAGLSPVSYLAEGGVESFKKLYQFLDAEL